MGGMAGDSEYNACLDNINELDRLGDALQAIGSELKKSGITKSGLVARAEDLTEDGRILSQETGQYLKNKLQSRSLDRQTRAQLERLGKQFQTVGNKFEIVSRQVLEQLRNVNDREGGALGDEEAGAWAGDERGGGGRSAQQTQLREPLLDDSQMQHQIQNALDRNKELRQLEADLGDLHTLFTDVATLAQMQQEHLDTIEGAVMESGMRVVAGYNELQKAHRTQKKARQRMCCMLVTGGLVVVILVWWIIGPLFR